MKGYIILVGISCLLLAACNNSAQFQSDLIKAANNCDSLAQSAYPKEAGQADIAKGLYPPKRGKIGKIVACITDQQRPVWAKNAPTFLDLYDAERSKIAVSAEKYDNGNISYKEYVAEGKQAAVDFNNAVNARALQEQGAGDERARRVAAALAEYGRQDRERAQSQTPIQTNCSQFGYGFNCQTYR